MREGRREPVLYSTYRFSYRFSAARFQIKPSGKRGLAQTTVFVIGDSKLTQKRGMARIAIM
jgi:hypothetical protein